MNRLRRWLNEWWKRRLPPSASIQLAQKSIFIVPTAAGYAFAVALLLMLLVAINYQNSLAYGLTFLLASVGLLSMLHTWRNLAGLQLDGLSVEPCFAGQTACFAVRLHAGRRSRSAIGLGWNAKSIESLSDIERESMVIAQVYKPTRLRGRMHAGRMRVETRFPLGIWVAWSWIDLAQSALVYPQPIEAKVELMGGAAGEDELDGVSSGLRGVDDYQGLEAWQQGDSLRRVNWKAWSKGQGLWVKHFTEERGSQLQLDFSSVSGDTEHRLSVLCYLVLKLSQQEQPFSLLLPGQAEQGPASGAQHQTDCLTALALFGGGLHDEA